MKSISLKPCLQPFNLLGYVCWQDFRNILSNIKFLGLDFFQCERRLIYSGRNFSIPRLQRNIISHFDFNQVKLQGLRFHGVSDLSIKVYPWMRIMDLFLKRDARLITICT